MIAMKAQDKNLKAYGLTAARQAAAVKPRAGIGRMKTKH
jgi:hypothetical protein